jgi:hypothetical protein
VLHLHAYFHPDKVVSVLAPFLDDMTDADDAGIALHAAWRRYFDHVYRLLDEVRLWQAAELSDAPSIVDRQPVRGWMHPAAFGWPNLPLEFLDGLPMNVVTQEQLLHSTGLQRLGTIATRMTGAPNVSREVRVRIVAAAPPSRDGSALPPLVRILAAGNRLGLGRTPEELWAHAKAVLGDIPLDHPLWGHALRSEEDRAGRVVCVGRSDSLDGDLLPLLSLCLGRQLCVYELGAVSQFTATTSASPIRRYGPDTTYFAPLCLAWDGRAFSWMQVLGARAEDSSPPPWSDALWRQKDSPWKWQAPWSRCEKCGLFGCHTLKDCPAPYCPRLLFKSGFSQRLSRRCRKFYGLPV